MDAKPIPDHPSLEPYRQQAEDLLQNLQAPESIRRIQKFHPRFSDKTALPISAAEFPLEDAQCVIAREHGFQNWAAFTGHIEALLQADSAVSRFERAADAIASGDFESLQKLLHEHPELVQARSTREHGAPLIHYVAANGIEDFRQKTPANILEITQLLLRAGAQVDAISDAYGRPATALGLAATSYHPAKAGLQLQLLDLLLRAGASVDGAPGGWNPLIAALHNGRGSAAVFLAERGARLDLESAAGTGRLDALSHLIQPDGTLCQKATQEQLHYGFTWACEYGRTSTVQFLLDRQYRPDPAFMHGETGLHWAAYGGHLEVTELLLKANFDLNAIDQIHHGTPLGWAVYGWANPAPESKNGRFHEIVALLVCAGATLDPAWLGDPHRGSSLAARIRSDPRMLAALGPESKNL